MPILDKKIEDLGARTVSLPSEEPADPTQRRIKPTPRAKPPRDRIGPVWGPNPADKTKPSWVRTPSEDGERDLKDHERIRWRALPGKPEDLKLAALKGKPYPDGVDRQRLQRGEAKKHDKLLYRKNRQKIRQRSNLWYQKNKRKPALKRDRKRRRDQPNRFKRLPGGWTSHSEKEKARRKEERTASRILDHLWLSRNLSWVLSRWGRGRGRVANSSEVWTLSGEPVRAIWLSPGRVRGWTDRGFFDCGVRRFFAQTRTNSHALMRRVALWVGSDFMVTDLVKKMDRPESRETRRWRVYPEHILRPPWTDPGFGDLPDLEGPYRAINPESPDHLPEKKPRTARVWSLLEAARKVSREIEKRTRQVRVRRIGKDSRGVVRFQALSPEGEPRTVEILQVGGEPIRAKCSCPAWIYQGCEFHARQGDYLLGAPQGTATPPRQRDPKRHNLVCKHVLAAIRWLIRGSEGGGSSRPPGIRSV